MPSRPWTSGEEGLLARRFVEENQPYSVIAAELERPVEEVRRKGRRWDSGPPHGGTRSSRRCSTGPASSAARGAGRSTIPLERDAGTAGSVSLPHP